MCTHTRDTEKELGKKEKKKSREAVLLPLIDPQSHAEEDPLSRTYTLYVLFALCVFVCAYVWE